MGGLCTTPFENGVKSTLLPDVCQVLLDAALASCHAGYHCPLSAQTSNSRLLRLLVVTLNLSEWIPLFLFFPLKQCNQCGPNSQLKNLET